MIKGIEIFIVRLIFLIKRTRNRMQPDRTIGITSTVPVEIIYAAGLIPVDINNLFIASADPVRLVRAAKMDGFPDTTCGWICGLYGSIMERGIKRVVAVTGGDCAETIALIEVLRMKGVEVTSFAYPASRDGKRLFAEMRGFAASLGASMREAEKQKKRLDAVRQRIHLLDELLWREGRCDGGEVRLLELSASDFEGDPEALLARVNEKIAEAGSREPLPGSIRLGVAGVPPIITDLYEVLEREGARVVFSEVERQFTLPAGGDLCESYLRYTYPYGIYARCEDIAREVRRRRIDGLIHYAQAFCFRGIEDIVLRKQIGVPVLTLQGDLPSRVTETMRVRIEAFLDMLARRRGRR